MIEVDETVDATPATLVNMSKFLFRNATDVDWSAVSVSSDPNPDPNCVLAPVNLEQRCYKFGVGFYSSCVLYAHYEGGVCVCNEGRKDINGIKCVSDWWHYFFLSGATLNNHDSPKLTVQLTELQRITAIRLSNTPGGDGSKIIFDAFAGALRDIGENENNVQLAIPVTEIVDEIPPTIINASLNMSTGSFIVIASETIQVTPSSIVDLSLVTIHNISLVGASVVPIEGISFTIILTELQRVRAIELSKTHGGYGSSLTVSALKGFVRDVSTNLNVRTENLFIKEIYDNLLPKINSASLNFSDGVLIVNATETIDTTPSTKVNLDKIFLSNETNADGQFSLQRAIVTEADSTFITISLTETQRVRALKISGVRGGDGASLFLSMGANAIADVAQNQNMDQKGIFVLEYADIVLPFLLNATVDLGTGIVTILASETIDIVPNTNVMLNHLFFDLTPTNTGNSKRENISLDSATVLGSDSIVMSIQMTEEQRVILIAHSSTPGGDGTASKFNARGKSIVDLSGNENSGFRSKHLYVNEKADMRPPYFVNATVNYSTGLLVIQASEFIDTTPKSLVNLSGIILSSDNQGYSFNLVGAHHMEEHDSYTVSIILSEKQRAAALRLSGTPGGDGGAVNIMLKQGSMQDIGQNGIIESTVSALDEYPDTLNPIISNVSINYTTGVLSVYFNETIDTTPISKVDLSKLILRNDPNSQQGSVSVSGAVVASADETYVRIYLSEFQRSKSIQISGLTGGDGSAILIDAYYGSFQDLSGNPQYDARGIVVEESPDIRPPTIKGVTIDYALGQMNVTYSETIRGSVSNSSRFFIGNVSGSKLVRLSSVDLTTRIEPFQVFVLSENQRIAAQYISKYFDDSPAFLICEMAAYEDVALLPNEFDLGQAMVELADRSSPKLIASDLYLSNPGLVVLKFNETMDVTPQADFVHLNYILLNNRNQSGSDEKLPLLGSTVDQVDSTIVTIRLIESTRARAVELSGTPGGDHQSLTISIGSGSMVDLMMNSVVGAANFDLVEHADIVLPVLVAVEIDYSTGKLVLNASETIDMTPPDLFKVNKIALADAPNAQPVAILAVTSTYDAVDTTSIVIQLPEAQRFAALKASSVIGGNGGAVYVTVARLMMQDLAGNPSESFPAVAAIEKPDKTPPAVLKVTADLNNGNVVIHLSETATIQMLNPRRMFLCNNTGERAMSLEGATVVSIADTATPQLILTEKQRVFAIMHSGTAGGDGHHLVMDF